jgi:hypothetical protein
MQHAWNQGASTLDARQLAIRESGPMKHDRREGEWTAADEIRRMAELSRQIELCFSEIDSRTSSTAAGERRKWSVVLFRVAVAAQKPLGTAVPPAAPPFIPMTASSKLPASFAPETRVASRIETS